MSKRTNYERGVETERKIMDILDEAGYVTFRTAGSHGCFDVGGIAPNGGVRLIQSKRAKKDTSWRSDFEQAVDQLRQLPRNPNVSYEVWVWVDYQGFVKMEVVQCE